MFSRATLWVRSEKREHDIFGGCSLFCLQLEVSCLQWSFFTYSCVWDLFYLQLQLFRLQFSLFAYSWSFFACSGKVHLTRGLRDCKPRSLSCLTAYAKKLPNGKYENSPTFFSQTFRALPGGALNPYISDQDISKCAFSRARCRLDGAFFVQTAPSLSRRRLPCGIPLERAVRIDVSSANCRAKIPFSSANFRAKSHFQISPFKMSPFRAS